MARRRKRRRSPRRRRSTARRRNAPRRRGFRLPPIVRPLQQGLIDATGVVAGKAGANIVSNFIPIPTQTVIGDFAKQGISAVVVGMVFRQIAGPQWGRMAMAGALAAPVENVLATLPVIGPMVTGAGVGEYPGLPMGEHPGLPIGEGQYYGDDMGAYVQADPGLAAYVEAYP